MVEEQETTEEIVETPEEETKEEVKEEPKTEDAIQEEKEGFVKGVMNKLGIGKTVPDPEEKEEDGDSFPKEFLEAAHSAGMTDDEIKEYSIYSDDDLKELIPFLTKEEPQQESAPAEEVTKPPEEKPALEEDVAWKQMVEKQNERISSLEEELKESKETRKTADQQKLIAQVNDAFDKASEKFEVFGKSKELPVFPAGPRKGELIPTSPAYKARSAVLEVANTLMAGGMDINTAMDTALDTYKGRSLEVDVKRSIVKDLKRNSKKLSAKRVGKETVKVFEDEEERKADVVRKAYAAKGIEL